MYLIGALQLREQRSGEREASSLFKSLQSICLLSALIGAKLKKTLAESPFRLLEIPFTVSKDNSIQFSLLLCQKIRTAEKRDNTKGNSYEMNSSPLYKGEI